MHFSIPHENQPENCKQKLTRMKLQEVADDVIREAEEARISGQDIVFAYGAAVNPNGEAVAVSSELGNLPADVLPMFSGALLQGWVSEESKIGSSLHEMSQVAGRDNGVPCMQRGGDESSVSQLPLGVVVVQGMYYLNSVFF